MANPLKRSAHTASHATNSHALRAHGIQSHFYIFKMQEKVPIKPKNLSISITTSYNNMKSHQETHNHHNGLNVIFAKTFLILQLHYITCGHSLAF